MKWGRRKPGERARVLSIDYASKPTGAGLFSQLLHEARHDAQAMAALAGIPVAETIVGDLVGWSPRDAAYLRARIDQAGRFG